MLEVATLYIWVLLTSRGSTSPPASNLDSVSPVGEREESPLLLLVRKRTWAQGSEVSGKKGLESSAA